MKSFQRSPAKQKIDKKLRINLQIIKNNFEPKVIHFLVYLISPNASYHLFFDNNKEYKILRSQEYCRKTTKCST